MRGEPLRGAHSGAGLRIARSTRLSLLCIALSQSKKRSYVYARACRAAMHLIAGLIFSVTPVRWSSKAVQITLSALPCRFFVCCNTLVWLSELWSDTAEQSYSPVNTSVPTVQGHTSSPSRYPSRIGHRIRIPFASRDERDPEAWMSIIRAIGE